MKITKQVVADKIAAYLQHKISPAELVDWAESAMMDGEFDQPHLETVRDVVARIGVADVRAFGLTWADCEQLLKQLGYRARIEILSS
jgi:cobyrinic acid a,c-diamide synthase